MDKSPLNRLSAELRNRIYDLVFEENFDLHITSPRDSHNLQHPLTRTCRQIREETIFVYLSRTKFEAITLSSDYEERTAILTYNMEKTERLIKWMKAQGPAQLKAIKCLQIFHFDWTFVVSDPGFRGGTLTRSKTDTEGEIRELCLDETGISGKEFLQIYVEMGLTLRITKVTRDGVIAIVSDE